MLQTSAHIWFLCPWVFFGGRLREDFKSSQCVCVCQWEGSIPQWWFCYPYQGHVASCEWQSLTMKGLLGLGWSLCVCVCACERARHGTRQRSDGVTVSVNESAFLCVWKNGSAVCAWACVCVQEHPGLWPALSLIVLPLQPANERDKARWKSDVTTWMGATQPSP